MTSTAESTKWILSLPPVADVFEELETAIMDAVGNPMLTGAKRIVFWVLVGAHALVVVLALLGVAVKYKRGGGWLFTRDAGNGLWRPSGSIVPQLLFALYGIFFLITVPTCILVRQPSYGAYLFSVLSYIPIGLAFHATVWSTLGVSLSTSSPIALNSPSSKRFRLPSYIGFWTALLFILCHAPVSAAVQVFRRRQQHALYELLEGIDEAAASGLGLVALAGLESLYNDLMSLSWKLFTLYRVEVGVYGVWAILWMLVYVPTSLHLFFTLRIRARLLARSIKSLRVLDELVTHDDLEAAAFEEMDLEKESMDPNDLAFSFARTPRLDTGAPRLPPLALSPLHSPHSPEISAFPSPLSSPRSGTTIRGPACPRSETTFDAWTIGRRGTSTTGAVAVRSGSRIAEMQADLAKVKRTLATIVMQFVVSCAMVFSFLPFCFIIISGNAHLVTGEGYQIWIGWTFSAPALVSSAVFLYFAIVGPSPPNPSAPTSPLTAAATSPLPLMTEFAPTSPTSPSLPSFANPTPSAPTRHMPRSPISSRRLARALRDFFEWPTNPLIRGSDSEASSDSTPSFVRSRHGSTSTARPLPSAEALLPPPTALLGRGKGKTRANSRPTTAESLMDPASAVTRRAPPLKGHKSKSSNSSSGTSAAMGLGSNERTGMAEEEVEKQRRVTVQSWVPSVWARGMRETEEQSRRSAELQQRQEIGGAE